MEPTKHAFVPRRNVDAAFYDVYGRTPRRFRRRLTRRLRAHVNIPCPDDEVTGAVRARVIKALIEPLARSVPYRRFAELFGVDPNCGPATRTYAASQLPPVSRRATSMAAAVLWMANTTLAQERPDLSRYHFSYFMARVIDEVAATISCVKRFPVIAGNAPSRKELEARIAYLGLCKVNFIVAQWDYHPSDDDLPWIRMARHFQKETRNGYYLKWISCTFVPHQK
jgi:hypothetical protein